MPPQARWSTIAAQAHTPEIGKVIDEAMRQIEYENPKLKGVLPKNFARQELDKRFLFRQSVSYLIILQFKFLLEIPLVE